ncbi:hypothetical protein [Lactococcus lactis]|jgi:hypothetical protein|uniref:hypothetical protein n=1 Tax=Lactococcus lactis TaxID=1358 RepID=UPI00241638FC|nr:hypothetical protein [Lactococcus lactis]MDG4958325.1 hypothetical protein [Lactococcus lactis]
MDDYKHIKDIKKNIDENEIPRTLKSLGKVENRGFQPRGSSDEIPRPASFKPKKVKKD